MIPKNKSFDCFFAILTGATITKVKQTTQGDVGFKIFFNKCGSKNQNIEVAFSSCEGTVYFNGEELLEPEHNY